ncbi:glucoamylase [Thermoanaerobacter thermohydrosulfuricus]|uniref:Glucoamylase n=1 Tax=Thermoanaerobacter thermohydrosulfuricus TaxID=1516 RepID=A0A1G7S3A9_THETY|nr:glucan 1,4-alpha-glucosidase [Thermoanaerobacter thermohydrosulfuricus]SDG17545.1 glucoamylase [Thermoanaerobacter thermohydrosulfuricus]
MNRKIVAILFLIIFSITIFSGCSSDVSYVKIQHLTANEAPQAPGKEDTWASAQKQGIGTANNDVSKVWFTLTHGAISEVYYPTIDMANSKFLKFLVTDGKSFVSDETKDTVSKVEKLNTRSLAFKLINTDKQGIYRITKEIFTDPRRNSVIMKITFEALKGNVKDYKLYLAYDPHIANQGKYNEGYVIKANDKEILIVHREKIYSALTTDVKWKGYSIGYNQVNDPISDLEKNKTMTQHFDKARGNIIEGIEIDLSDKTEFKTVLSFGESEEEAAKTALSTLKDNYDKMLGIYIAEWNKYCDGLKDFKGNANELYYTSMMILKASEDKTNKGAYIASLSIPWGEGQGDENKGGYHLVWARDLYHIANAFIAAGDKDSANRALDFLTMVVEKNGFIPQNTWINGGPYWNGIQMDEQADPIILAYQLKRYDLYEKLVKPLADFIIKIGPKTGQERWEEAGGYSPATMAAEVAGLVCAADIAKQNKDMESAQKYLDKADKWQKLTDELTYTTKGPYGNGQYYIRIAGLPDPNADFLISIANGGGVYDQKEIVDPSFLELVRLGVKPANDPKILTTIYVVDNLIKVNTPKGPCWYRYNHDGYGEPSKTELYHGTGKGRLWPLLTGERGMYEIAAGKSADEYLKAMENFANQGYVLSEQVWEDTGLPTDSASPLNWAHAEYVVLFVSNIEHKVADMPQIVYDRYVLGKK